MTTTATRTPRRSPAQRAAAAKTRAAHLEAAHQMLTTQTQALANSPAWMAMLAGAARLRRYSASNILLILAACPQATSVATAAAWKRQGFHPRRGTTALRVLAPLPTTITETDEATGETTTRTFTRYKTLPVFDVSQVDPYDPTTPTPAPRPLATPADPNLLAALTDYATHIGWTVTESTDLRPGLMGTASTDGTHTITLAATQSGADKVATLIHELGHVILGHTDDPADYRAHRGRAEVEAESFAYIVAAGLGLDTATYSVAYITGWDTKDPDVLMDSAAHVIKTAHTLLDHLDPTD